MSTIFLKILNISFTAGWLILAVVALRLLLSTQMDCVSFMGISCLKAFNSVFNRECDEPNSKQ